MKSETQNNEKHGFIHHFIPHHHHKTRARLLSIKSLFSYAVIAAFFFVSSKVISYTVPGVLGYASNINIEAMLHETNKIRAKKGLNSLTLNASLSAAAQNKANHMFSEDYWAHISPSGVKPWDFILAQGYDYQYAGENLAKNFNSSRDVVDAWYDSPSHRENLLGTDYDEVGFAVVNGRLNGQETTLVVQMFARPRSPSYVASVPETPEPAFAPAPAPVPEPVVLHESAFVEESVPLAVPEPKKANPELQDEVVIFDKPIPEVDKDLAFVPPVPSSVSLYAPSTVINIHNVSRALFAMFLAFMLSLFLLDVWYSRLKGIPKFTGHTLAHMLYLFSVLVSVWFVISPGRIL